VIESPLNDTGDKLAVSGEFNRIIAAAINVDPRWFFALGRRVMGEDRRGVPGSLRLGCHSDTRKTRRSRPCDAFNEMVVGPGVADLVDLGFLARQTTYAGQPPDLFRCLDRQW